MTVTGKLITFDNGEGYDFVTACRSSKEVRCQLYPTHQRAYEVSAHCKLSERDTSSAVLCKVFDGDVQLPQRYIKFVPDPQMRVAEDVKNLPPPRTCGPRRDQTCGNCRQKELTSSSGSHRRTRCGGVRRCGNLIANTTNFTARLLTNKPQVTYRQRRPNNKRIQQKAANITS